MNALTVRLPFEPHPHQRAAHKGRKRFSVLAWHRRAGKTVFAVLELVLAAAACKRQRGRFAYIAPLLKQAKDVAWEYVKHYTRAIPGCVYNETELSVTLPNGHMVRLYGADHPDSLRGIYFDGVVVDEVADMKPELWGSVLRPALADREGWALFIGTPKGANLFSELYYAALGDDSWFSDLKTAYETGVIPPPEIEAAKREMSEPQFAQEFLCDFAAAVENTLLPLEAVIAAQDRTVKAEEYLYAPKVLGIDVARYGGDETVFAPRQGIVAMQQETHRGLNVVEVVSHAARVIDSFKPAMTFVDSGGIGAGVFDGLGALGYPVSPVDFGSKPSDARFENKRAEIWWLMADWVKAGGCLPKDPKLTAQLTAPTYTYRNARGKLQLESKDAMRARGMPSPDHADALAVTFAMPVAATEMDRLLVARRPVSPDYDPYQERTA